MATAKESATKHYLEAVDGKSNTEARDIAADILGERIRWDWDREFALPCTVPPINLFVLSRSPENPRRLLPLHRRHRRRYQALTYVRTIRRYDLARDQAARPRASSVLRAQDPREISREMARVQPQPELQLVWTGLLERGSQEFCLGARKGRVRENAPMRSLVAYDWYRFVLQLISLAGLHLNATATAELAARYKTDGMLAYVDLVQQKEKELGCDVLTHQKWSVAPCLLSRPIADRILTGVELITSTASSQQCLQARPAPLPSGKTRLSTRFEVA